ncbi:hypothetical protein E4U41_007714, partial [Claviceps citrina]
MTRPSTDGSLQGPGPADDAGDDFVEQSYLTYAVPSRTNLDLDQSFRDVDVGESILDALEQRDSLYFDETVEVLLVLKMPWLDEDALRARIRRLVISLEVRIANAGSADRDTLPAAETIFKGHADDVADPFTIVGHDGSSQHVHAMWKLPVFLARPRMRLQRPAVLFSASASLRPAAMGDISTRGSGCLQSGMPSSFNLLEAFASDPALHGVQPRL